MGEKLAGQIVMRISPPVLGLLVLLTSPGLSGGQEADCNLCVAIVGAIEEFILNGDTMDDILNNVEGICSSFGALQGLCESFLENNLPGIIEGIIENNLGPYGVCTFIGFCSSTEPPTTAEPRAWQYIETMLEGGRVLTVEPDKHHVWMAHKQHAAGYQMWRLEDGGCLRNQEHMDRCLGIVGHSSGSGLELQIDNDLPIHHWKFEDKYIVNLAEDSGILVPKDLSLNVVWADIPLVTDGAALNVKGQDDTLSMHWKFVDP